MQNICVLLSTLMVTVNVRLTKSEFDNLPAADSEYDAALRKNSGENGRWLGQSATPLDDQQQREAAAHAEPDDFLRDYEYSINAAALSPSQYEDATRLLFNSYVNLLRKNFKLAQDRENSDRRSRIDKRAITMLSRWKPFRLTTSTSSSNGRHVIRSPYVGRATSDKIVGRPFRWG